MIGGIDEAGRGPVFGPLVVAGVSGPSQPFFRDLGVRDSKVLSAEARTRIARLVRSDARKVEWVAIGPEEIDARRREETLNEIEASAFAWVGRRLGVSELFVDAADVDAPRFGREIARRLGPEAPRVVAEHRADARFPVVSAASIIAKVERDRLVTELARPLEEAQGMPLGSGYPSDDTTVRFLETYRRQHGRFPAGTRLTWDTVRTMEERLATRRLEDFFTRSGPARPAGT